MKLAIMQPYLFPYIGYFQLLNAVDKFVFYDDVAFIKQGWVNRNNILLNSRKHMFSVPVKGISSFTSINDTYIADTPVNWEKKLLATISMAYSKAPFFKEGFLLIESVMNGFVGLSAAELAKNSIKLVLDYVGVKKNTVESSSIYNNQYLKSEERVIDICRREGADTYINAIGGQKLYVKEHFAAAGQKLVFIKPVLTPYMQFGNLFVEGLSIIDIIMFNEPLKIRDMINQYELI